MGFNCIVSTLYGLETNCSPCDRFCITRMVSSTYRNHTKGSKNASPISRLFDRLLPYIVYSMQYWLRSASGCCRVRVFFCVFGNLFCFPPFALSLPLNRFHVSFLLRKKKKTETSATEGTTKTKKLSLLPPSLQSRVLKVEVSISDKG